MGKRIAALLLVLALGFTFQYAGQNAQAKSEEIQVYFDGKRLTFDGVDPVAANGRTLVPFRKIFETLGFTVKWVGSEQKAVGAKDGLTIELTMNNKNAKVNGKTVVLDVPAQAIKGSTLVPLRFVSENSGYHVYYAKENGVSVIGIGSTKESAKPGAVVTPSNPNPSNPPASADKAEPYVVKGRVVNAEGQPVPYAEVFADNTFLYNSNILGVTDAQGNYRLELPNVSTSYRMGANFETEFAGVTYTFHMEPKPNHAFAGSDGAVRNFELNTNTGQVAVHSWDSIYPEDENAPWFEMHEVEFTLKPVGKLLDGSAGRTITGFPIYHDGARLMEIPIGTYEVSAVWKPKGYKEVPLLVAIRHVEQYQESVTFSFTNPFGDYHLAEIEVQFP